MTEDKKLHAKNTLCKILDNIFVERKDLRVGMDYVVPVSFQLNPHSLQPYAVDAQKDNRYFVDFCIGKRVGEEILPGVCITVLNDISPSSRGVHNNAYAFKTLHRQARYGVLLFGMDHIPADVLNDEQLCYIDFIEALGHIFEHEDKLQHVLEKVIEAQLQSGDNISSALFGDSKIRSISKRYS